MRWYQASHLISCSREAHNFLARDMYCLRWSKLVNMFDISCINHQSSIINHQYLCLCLCGALDKEKQFTAHSLSYAAGTSVGRFMREIEDLTEPNWTKFYSNWNWTKSNGFLDAFQCFPFLFHFCTLYMAPWLEQGLFHHPGHPSWELPPAWTCRCQHFQWPGSTVGFPSSLVPCISFQRLAWANAGDSNSETSLCSWEAATVTSFMCSSTQSSVMSSILGEKHNSWIMDQILFEAISLELWWLPVPSLECMIIIMSDRHRWFIEFCFIWPALDWQSMQARIRTLQKAQPKIFLSSVATSSSSEVERSMSLCNSFW